MFSGAFTLPIASAVGVALGGAVSYGIDEVARRRMLMVEDYIDRHPEQFVEPRMFTDKHFLSSYICCLYNVGSRESLKSRMLYFVTSLIFLFS